MERKRTIKVCRCCEWYEKGQGGMLGKCRYNPPDVFDGWVSVYGDDWCSKWEGNKEKMTRFFEEEVDENHIKVVETIRR